VRCRAQLRRPCGVSVRCTDIRRRGHTAGISENSPEIRARICRGAAWLGLRLDEAANRAGSPRISTPDSKVSAWVIPTDEEHMIAEHTLKIWRDQAVFTSGLGRH